MKESGYNDSKIELRISDSFYHRAGHFALEGSSLDVSSLEMPGFSFNAQQATTVFDGKATLLSGAELAGIWHYSANQIDLFTEDEATESIGKFGRGTYFGAGELNGETVDFLKSRDTIRHDAKLTGNVLTVVRDDVQDVARQLKTINGLPQSGFKSSIKNAPLTDLLETTDVAGQQVDAILITMQEGNSAELVVLPRSVSNISVVSPES
jgi:hypothetical protein